MSSARGGWRAVSVTLIHEPDYQGLPAPTRLVLLTLRLLLGATGIDVLYQAVLEEATGLSRDEVASALSELISAGWIQRERNVTWLVEGLRQEPSRTLSNSNHATEIRRHADSLPRLAIVDAFRRHYGLIDDAQEEASNAMGDGIGDALEDALEDGIGDGIGEQRELRVKRERERETTTTPARERACAYAREKFPDVAVALEPPDEPDLLQRFLAAVADPDSPTAVEAHRAYLRSCLKALGLTTGRGLSAPALAEAVRHYLTNRATGSERFVNAGRFEAYLRRAYRVANEARMASAADRARPGGRPGLPPDPATELLDVLEAGGLLASGRSREAYWRRVGEVAAERGRDPAEFEAVVRLVKPWELGEITWRPDQLAKIRHRLAHIGPTASVGPTPEVAA